MKKVVRRLVFQRECIIFEKRNIEMSGWLKMNFRLSF